MDSPVQLDGDETFVNYQPRIIKRCKALVKCTSDMSSASNMMSDRPEQLQVLAKRCTDEYTAMVVDGATIVQLADSDEVCDCVVVKIAYNLCVSLNISSFNSVADPHSFFSEIPD